jgi:hypothetical protein
VVDRIIDGRDPNLLINEDGGCGTKQWHTTIEVSSTIDSIENDPKYVLIAIKKPFWRMLPLHNIIAKILSEEVVVTSFFTEVTETTRKGWDRR